MNALNLPSETSQDIWTVDPSLYGPSWDVASLPASLTITGDFGGTERIVNINCPKGYGHKWPIRGNDSR